MVNKELKKLNRGELLEMLIIQTRKAEALEKKLAEANEGLMSRELQIKEAGNLAEAVMRLNGIFEAAQNASSQYMENIDLLKARCREECDGIRQEAEAEAEKIIKAARQEAERIISEASSAARKINEKKTNQNKNKKKKR